MDYSLKKHIGSFYTPNYLTDFISKTIAENNLNSKKISVLEPSVGDGAFLCAISKFNNSIRLTAVDQNDTELLKAKHCWKQHNAKFVHADFLELELKKKFDIIIGNPPYIKKSRLSENQLKLSYLIHEKNNLSEKSVKNIWTTFLVKSISLLKTDGVLAFVLPAELLQVKFAEEIREYLKNEFERIEVFTFNDLLFECKGQDTIILFAYKKHKEKGEFFTNIENKSTLRSGAYKLVNNDLLVESKVKWTHHFLTSEEIKLLNSLRSELDPIEHYCNSKPGIVTAANNFFIIDKEVEAEYNLMEYTKPIIQKGLFVKNGVVYKKEYYDSLSEQGYPTRLLQLNDDDKISPFLKQYLAIGEKREIPNRYKCKKRNNWYVIPNIAKQPEAFFFKRCHQYPKLLRNDSDAFVTDSAYKVEMKEKFDLNSFIYSFYNSLTLCFAEIDGRYYGGGVLELTPNEFKKLPLPYINIGKRFFNTYVKEFEKKNNIDQILEKYDSFILGEELGLKKSQIEMLQRIRKKLIAKRMRK